MLEIARGKMPRLERKHVEPAGDRFMAEMGFHSIHFSQSRATQQTPGISDRRYYNITRGVSAWWEAKAEDGRQAKDEWVFQRIVEACGEVYLLGTEEVLAAWCQMRCPDYLSISSSEADRAKLQPPQFRYRAPKPRTRAKKSYRAPT